MMRNILSPGEFKEFAPSRDPMTVGDSVFTTALNVRYEDGAYKARPVTDEMLATPDGSATFCGGAAFFNGTTTEVYCAMNNAGTVSVYRATYNGSTFSAWSAALTSALSAPDGLVSFAYVEDAGVKSVVIQDGSSDARIYKASAINDSEKIEPPARWSAQWKPASAKAINASDAIVTLAGVALSNITTAGLPNSNRFVTSSALSSGTSGVTFSSAADLSGSKQTWIVVSQIGNFIDNVTWELTRTSGGNAVLNDPVAVVPIGGGAVILAFDTEQFDLSSVTGYEFTFVNQVSSGAQLDVYGVVAAGNVPGGAEYVATHAEKTYTDNVNESAPVVLPNIVYNAPQTIFGLRLPEGARLPIVSTLYYEPRVYRQETNGLYVYLYRKDPGEDEYYFLAEDDMSVVGKQEVYDDAIAPEDKNFTYKAPDVFSTNTPTGVSFSAGGRHYVGSGNKIYVSDDGRPFRFREVTEQSPLYGDGWTATLDAGEEVYGFAASSASVVGQPQVYAFTSGGVYQLYTDGRILRVSSIGCEAGFSVNEYQGAIWFLGKDRQFYRMQGGISDESRDTVDSKLEALSSTKQVSGVFHDQRRHFALGTEELVYNSRYGRWEASDNIGVKQYIPWPHTDENRLMAFLSDGSLVDLTSGHQDEGGAGVTCTLETGYLYAFDDNETYAGVFKVLTNQAVAVTTTRTDLAGTTKAGAIAATASTPMWREDRESGKTFKPGMDAHGVKLKISWTATSGLKLYGWQADVHSAGDGVDA